MAERKDHAESAGHSVRLYREALKVGPFGALHEYLCLPGYGTGCQGNISERQSCPQRFADME